MAVRSVLLPPSVENPSKKTVDEDNVNLKVIVMIISEVIMIIIMMIEFVIIHFEESPKETHPPVAEIVLVLYMSVIGKQEVDAWKKSLKKENHGGDDLYLI